MIRQEHFDFVMRKAKQHKLIVTGHLGSLSTRYAVEQGINGLEHGLAAIRDFGGNPNDYVQHPCHVADLDLTREDVGSLIDLIVKNKVYIDPTLVIFESMSPRFQAISDMDFFLDDRATRVQALFDQNLGSQLDSGCIDKQLQKQLHYCKMIFDRGGILVAGTDPVSGRVLPGFAMKREIILFTQAGIPLQHAVKIASLNAAQVLGISDKKGSIEIGKDADLSLIDGDATADINLIYKTRLVLKKGVIHQSQQLLDHSKDKVSSAW
jgi:enamidase